MATATKGSSSAKPAAKAPLVAEFAMEKATPGTIRFQQDKVPGERPSIGTLYITKEALASLGDFKRIRVTVEAAD